MLFKSVVALSLMACAVQCFQTYRSRLPNGDHVLDPCDGSAWGGVGHNNPKGGGALNQFGIDFANAYHVWSRALCNMDSDGDGNSNGYELGDPNCLWSASNPTALGPVMGNPGVCEPIRTTQCAAYNVFLPC